MKITFFTDQQANLIKRQFREVMKEKNREYVSCFAKLANEPKQKKIKHFIVNHLSA